jgi:hypothetical protein
MTGLELLEEYRPAWETEPRWEIRTEDGRWVRVQAWFEYTSTEPGLDPVTVLWIADGTEVRVYSDTLVMSRKLEPSTTVPATMLTYEATPAPARVTSRVAQLAGRASVDQRHRAAVEGCPVSVSDNRPASTTRLQDGAAKMTGDVTLGLASPVCALRYQLATAQQRGTGLGGGT